MTESTLPPVSIFAAWVALLALIIAAVVIYRWRRPNRYSRLQLKLTLILILFLLVPTVPLLLVVGAAIDQARGLLVALPVDDALEQGLVAVRLALREEEARLSAWRDGLTGDGLIKTDAARPDFTMRFERTDRDTWAPAAVRALSAGGPVPADTLVANPPDPRGDEPRAIADAVFTGDERVLFHYRGSGVFMALVRPPEAEYLEAAGIWVDPQIVAARSSVNEGLMGFRRITLLGRGLRDVVWILASLWLVVLTLAAFWTTRLLAGGISGPVIDLARGMERVAGGDLDTRLEIRARDEMRVLVTSFNSMTDQLREARERIVTVEKQAAWQDVARRIAHEIKNPLTPLQLGLHRVRSRLQREGIWESDDALRESIGTMSEEVEALRRMAAAFSEFAELPRPVMRVDDIESVVRSAVALFQEGPRNARIDVHVHGPIEPVAMDADLVKRAVINLIKNAVESVEATHNGHVRVRLERRGDEILLEIRDNGAGFDPGVADRLFDPDFTTKSKGTGLGLSMVARIVADHGWKISAESEGHERGATVQLLIPLGKEPAS